jgi:hypothetical protein
MKLREEIACFVVKASNDAAIRPCGAVGFGLGGGHGSATRELLSGHFERGRSRNGAGRGQAWQVQCTDQSQKVFKRYPCVSDQR